MPTLQEVLQQAKTLPLDEQLTLAEFLLEQAKQDAQSVSKPSTQIDEKVFERPDMVRKREREWLRENWREYLGQWVAIEGDQLISHGYEARPVFVAVRAAGIKVPFVVQVEDPTIPQIGGW